MPSSRQAPLSHPYPLVQKHGAHRAGARAARSRGWTPPRTLSAPPTEGFRRTPGGGGRAITPSWRPLGRVFCHLTHAPSLSISTKARRPPGAGEGHPVGRVDTAPHVVGCADGGVSPDPRGRRPGYLAGLESPRVVGCADGRVGQHTRGGSRPTQSGQEPARCRLRRRERRCLALRARPGPPALSRGEPAQPAPSGAPSRPHMAMPTHGAKPTE